MGLWATAKTEFAKSWSVKSENADLFNLGMFNILWGLGVGCLPDSLGESKSFHEFHGYSQMVVASPWFVVGVLNVIGHLYKITVLRFIAAFLTTVLWIFEVAELGRKTHWGGPGCCLFLGFIFLSMRVMSGMLEKPSLYVEVARLRTAVANARLSVPWRRN